MLENEKELIKRSKKDISAFDKLYEHYFPLINNYVYHRVNDESIRYEIVSNTFYKAMTNLSSFQWLHTCSFSAWLYRIAINEIRQHYRQNQRMAKIENKIVLNQLPIGSEDIAKPDYQRVKQAMLTLKPEEQDLLSLRYFEKKKFQEIAEILNVKEGALKVRMHRILNKLRERLEGENNG
ncbi:MAG: sigma-70 family RNA polymerase sigma factor [Candidatus Cloacimonetes bacterium]|nr:sigma-70 family RNA polymerase sigma factor [Candidatus Cloacimonadota bacterium]